QQQPKEALKTRDGKELFHPRKAFVTDEGKSIYYFDYKNMELRVQALYTILVNDGDGDLNLCQAFVPFKYKSMFTGEEYDFEKDYNDWDSGEWVDEDGNPWIAVDVHTASTLQAFPDKSVDDPDFAHYRSLGKRANFAKNYGSGASKIAQSLRISEELAKAFSDGYYKAFPKIKDYQRYVEDSIYVKGYIENLFGRRYYFRETGNSYKGYNYLIQGFGADLLKLKEIEVDKFLRKGGYKSKMLMVVHDEVQVLVEHGEEAIVPKIAEILENCREYSKYIPMTCDVEVTHTNWADKEGYDGNLGYAQPKEK
ncbi:MAG: DNA polymerase, partial [Saccharofermentanales bacterium]